MRERPPPRGQGSQSVMQQIVEEGEGGMKRGRGGGTYQCSDCDAGCDGGYRTSANVACQAAAGRQEREDECAGGAVLGGNWIVSWGFWRGKRLRCGDLP